MARLTAPAARQAAARWPHTPCLSLRTTVLLALTEPLCSELSGTSGKGGPHHLSPHPQQLSPRSPGPASGDRPGALEANSARLGSALSLPYETASRTKLSADVPCKADSKKQI